MFLKYRYWNVIFIPRYKIAGNTEHHLVVHFGETFEFPVLLCIQSMVLRTNTMSVLQTKYLNALRCTWVVQWVRNKPKH